MGQARVSLAMAEGSDNAGVSTKKRFAASASWASILSKSLSPSLSKNVIEVVLEKDVRGGFSVSDSDCAQLISNIGINQKYI